MGIARMMKLDELRGDSPDFTQAEAEGAMTVSAVSDMIQHLRSLDCQTCGSAVFPIFHEQRRREGVLYCRMRLDCGSLHEVSIVFRVQEMQPSESP